MSPATATFVIVAQALFYYVCRRETWRAERELAAMARLSRELDVSRRVAERERDMLRARVPAHLLLPALHAPVVDLDRCTVCGQPVTGREG